MTTWADVVPPATPLDTAARQRYHAFLSYRSTDRPWVLNLYDVLRANGFEVFVDQVALKPGDKLVKALEDGLKTSRAGILIWSAVSADSDWVRREYEVMETRGDRDPSFNFVPVKLDDSELPDFAERRLFLDFSSYPDGPNGGELLRLLYAIEGKPLSEQAVRFAADQDRLAQAAVAEIDAEISNGRPERLIELFEDGGPPWEHSSALGCKAAEGLVALKQNNRAIEVLTQLEETFPLAIRPRQLRALALARRGGDGDLEEAQSILGILYAAKERDPETVGIYARTWMDRYSRSGDLGDLRRSRDLYVEAFTGATDDYYTGINAAAKSVLLGDLDSGATHAAAVEEIVGDQPTPGDYWASATAAEVQLLQQNYERAGELYEAAVAMAHKEVGSHESTWLQACRLMASLEPTDDQRARVRAAFTHLPACEDLPGFV